MQGRVAERQRWAWLFAALSVVGATVLCRWNWIWVAIGAVVVTVYYIWIDRWLPEQGLAAMMAKTLGPFALLLTILWNIVVMGWAATLADAAFPMVDGFPILGWIVLTLAAWASWKGAAACARCCGVLCMFLLFLYGVVVLFAIPDLRVERLTPVGSWKEIVWAAGLVLTVSGVWYLPCTRSKTKPVWPILLLLPAICVLPTGITAGVLSPELAKIRPVPFYDLARSVSLFGVIERIESLLSAAMIMGVFSLLASMALSCRTIIQKDRYGGVFCCVAAGAAMYLKPYFTVERIAVGAWIIWFFLPILAIVVDRCRK